MLDNCISITTFGDYTNYKTELDAVCIVNVTFI